MNAQQEKKGWGWLAGKDEWNARLDDIKGVRVVERHWPQELSGNTVVLELTQ